MLSLSQDKLQLACNYDQHTCKTMLKIYFPQPSLNLATIPQSQVTNSIDSVTHATSMIRVYIVQMSRKIIYVYNMCNIKKYIYYFQC
jgi:hypothetical protein